MSEEELEIIEIEEEEYVIADKLNVDDKLYFVLVKIIGDELQNEYDVVREENGFVSSIEDEEELKKVLEELDKRIEEYTKEEKKTDSN